MPLYQLSDDVVATLTQASHWMKDDSRQVRMTFSYDEHKRIMAALDDAIAALAALVPVQQEWEPIKERNTWSCSCGEPDCEAMLTTESDDMICLENEAGYWSFVLPDYLRICRRTQAQQPAATDAAQE